MLSVAFISKGIELKSFLWWWVVMESDYSASLCPVHFSKKRSKKKMDKVHDKMLYAMFIEPSLRWVCEKELTAAALVSQAKLAIVPNKIESLHYKN